MITLGLTITNDCLMKKLFKKKSTSLAMIIHFLNDKVLFLLPDLHLVLFPEQEKDKARYVSRSEFGHC